MKNIAYVIMGVVAAVMLATAVGSNLAFAYPWYGEQEGNTVTGGFTGGAHCGSCGIVGSANGQTAGTSINNQGVSGGGSIG